MFLCCFLEPKIAVPEIIPIIVQSIIHSTEIIMNEQKSLQDILNAKTDRELIEESIHQNIAIYKKLESIHKRIEFIHVIAILAVIGVLFSFYIFLIVS